jgi:two-component system, cell cycle response regulator DivK
MATILIVEDIPSSMMVTRVLLESVGHSAIAAKDAERGLQIVETQDIDLVLMDLNLPGMDGLEATRMLKSNPSTATIPVIALTAMTRSEDEEKALAAGCDAYIAKYVSPHRLFAEIEAQLAKRSLRGPLQ